MSGIISQAVPGSYRGIVDLVLISLPFNKLNYLTFQRVSYRRMEIHEEKNNKKLSA